MQKFEVYDQGVLKGQVSFNKPLMKKILSVSLSAVISVGTITGCSFNKVSNDKEEIHIEERTYNSLDQEIMYKNHFVNAVLEEFNNEINANGNVFIQKKKELLMEEYRSFANLEYELTQTWDPKMFITEEEIDNAKIQMIEYLDRSINIIESETEYRYGVDFPLGVSVKK